MSRRTPEDLSDEALVAAYVAGDNAALDALVARYRRRVFGICLRYFNDPHEAEEAAQETFVALLRRAETFTGAARFSSWLYRVATNCCHDLARRRSAASSPSSGTPWSCATCTACPTTWSLAASASRWARSSRGCTAAAPGWRSCCPIWGVPPTGPLSAAVAPARPA